MAKEGRKMLRVEKEDIELIIEAAKLKTKGNASKFIIEAAIAKAKRDLAKGK